MLARLAVFCALLLVAQIPLASAQCPTVTDPNDSSKVYDLNALSNAAADYSCVNSRYPSYNFLINVCRGLVTTDSVCGADSGICEKSSFSSSKVAGLGSTFTVTSEGNLQMTYAPGSGCFYGVINFKCVAGAGAGSPVYVSEDCVYTFTWETEYACSSSGGGGGGGGGTGGLSIGSILCIIFFCSVFLYIAIGMGVKFKKYDARGVDMVPNIDFWREVPGLIKDGFNFTISKFRRS